MRHFLAWGSNVTESKTANQLKAIAGAAVAVVTLVGMIVAGVIWVHTVKTDTDRALVAVGKLESRLDEQASATRELHTAVLNSRKCALS